MARYAKAAPVDVYQAVTDQIVRLLETGVQPWSRSWAGDALLRPLRHNGQSYRGINPLILWLAQMEKGYTNAYWMTFNQAAALDAQVRKGEHGTKIVFYAPRVINEGTDDEKRYPVLRTFTVFNAEQIDGLPEKYQTKIVPPIKAAPKARNAAAEAFFEALGLKLKHGGAQAFYMISQDRIQLPAFEAFQTADAYYTTLGHETAHWTRHPSRLDRNFNSERWGDEGYAMEELVAELAAAYLAGDLGLVNHPREDHASYIASWLKVLKNDKKAIFTAASYAEKAVTFLHGLANPEQTDDEEETQDRLAA